MISKIAIQLFYNPAENLTPEEEENLRWYHQDAPSRDIVAANRRRGYVGAGLGAIPGALGLYAAAKGRSVLGGAAALAGTALGSMIGHNIATDKYSPDSAQDVIYKRKNVPSLEQVRQAMNSIGMDARTRRELEDEYNSDERSRIDIVDAINNYRANRENAEHMNRQLLYDAIWR